MTMLLERLTIQAYKDQEYSERDGPVFVVWMNPQSYQRSLAVQTVDLKAINGSAPCPTYARIGEESLTMTLVFDTTGVIPNPQGGEDMPANGVSALLEALIDKIAKTNPDTDRPNFLQLSWAQLQARCVLTNMSIDYKLFRPDGTPIRANANLSFLAYTSTLCASRLTHNAAKQETQVVTLLPGDTLPALCSQIYGQSSLYLKVARYNGLLAFRSLRSGTQVLFPPLAQLH